MDSPASSVCLLPAVAATEEVTNPRFLGAPNVKASNRKLSRPVLARLGHGLSSAEDAESSWKLLAYVLDGGTREDS
jgi:hypothetical protein